MRRGILSAILKLYKPMVAIVDYGMGNLRSVFNKFRKMGVPAMISSNHEEIQKAEKLILPGVGHFANGMKHLKETGLIELLNHKVIAEKTEKLSRTPKIKQFYAHPHMHSSVLPASSRRVACRRRSNLRR